MDSNDIAFKIVSSLDNNGLCAIKCVLVTGDIFDGQVDYVTGNLIKEAISFFQIILEQVNLIQEEFKLNKNDFVFVPGNHDIIKVENEIDRWKKYNDFLVGFYGNIPDFYHKGNQIVIKRYDNERIVFIGFNSCQLEKKLIFDELCIKDIQKISNEKINKLGLNKNNIIELLQNENNSKIEYNVYGKIQLSHISNVRSEIKKLVDYNVVALFHHHFYLFPELVQKQNGNDSSLLRNYTDVIRELKYMNVKTVLHGHKHFDLERPVITEEYYKTTNSIIDVFAGGSVGTDRKDKHTFSVIDFYDEKYDIKLIQNKFVYSEESLEIINKQIPPQNNNNSGKIIELIEIFKSTKPDIHSKYDIANGKMNKTYFTCGEIIKWTDKVLTGFKDVNKHLDSDYKNILFILYAINYRTVSYKNIMESEQNSQHNSQYKKYFEILKELFNDCLNDSNIEYDEFHSLFAIKELASLKKECDKLIHNSTKQTKQYLAFSMVGIFFTDLYLVLTEYADDFYNQNIKFNVNIKLEQNEFHQNVPIPSIKIESDPDRRSVYIQLICNEATAHKIAVLFIKEFDLLINKYEDYFKIIGLKLYYLLPKVENNNLKDSFNNYNFEAYIPTLLPLLTGNNIYPSKEVFARELIQNSIDALAVREAIDDNDFDKTIKIEMGKDEDSKSYFKIKDCGTGMDRYKIERYFTSIGRSFYSGNKEYDDLNIMYKPISNFGIGFLSSFMVCKEIDVKTKSFILESEGLKLHIPNYDGCFFIEREDEINVGTEIKLYLNRDVDYTEIVNYIEKVMKDVKYEIEIKINNQQPKIINSFNVRKNNESCKFFVPFKENGEVPNIDWENEIKTENYIQKHEYGLLIKNQKFQEIEVLNSGISVRESSLFDILEINKESRLYNIQYCSIFANFPSNWIQIDVSREISKSFSEEIILYNKNNSKNTKGDMIALNLFNQLLNYLNYSKNYEVNSLAIYIQEILQFSTLLCSKYNSKLQNDLSNMYYKLFIKITEHAIVYIIDHKNKEYKYSDNSYYFESDMKMVDQLKKSEICKEMIINEKIDNDIFENILDFIVFRKSFNNNYYHINLDNFAKYFEKFGFELHNSDNVFTLLTMSIFASSMNKTIKSGKQLLSQLTYLALETMTVSDIENGKNEISVRIYDIENQIKYLERQHLHDNKAERDNNDFVPFLKINKKLKQKGLSN